MWNTQKDDLGYQYTKNPTLMTPEEKAAEFGRLWDWNKLTPEQKRAELERKKDESDLHAEMCTPDEKGGSVSDRMLIAPPPKRIQRAHPAAVELLGDLSDLGLSPSQLNPIQAPEMKRRTNETAEQVWLMEEARISEVLFEKAVPALPEDVRYVSQAIGESISGWGVGRYVIDAGTGAGKTTAIMGLLKKNVTSQPRFEVEGRKRILYLCNRKALWEQIIQAIFGDGYERDFRDWALVQWDMRECLSFEFIDVQTYQKLQKDYQEDPEKTLEHIKSCYTYIVCDEAHYFVNDAKFNHKTNVAYQCIEQLVSCKTVIYMSATMDFLIQKWKEEGTLSPENYYRIPRRKSCVSEIRFYYRDAERKALLDSIPPNENVIVFVTSYATLEKMKLIYGDTASYYCSGNNIHGSMDALYDCVRDGKLLKRILFTTTVLYNGVDIKDETVKHIFIEQWLPMEVIQEIGRKRPLDENDTCKLYLRGKGMRELETRLKEASYNLEPALCYHTGGEVWKKFLGTPDVNERIGEESVLNYDHRTGEYHINEMKEMLFLYQRSTALKMLQKGYHDAILSMIRDDLGGPIPEYKSDDAAAYIAEHLNEPMLKEDLKAGLIRALGIVPAKGRSSKETIGKSILNRELQKYGVEIESTRATSGKWRFKTVWTLIELA